MRGLAVQLSQETKHSSIVRGHIAFMTLGINGAYRRRLLLSIELVALVLRF